MNSPSNSPIILIVLDGWGYTDVATNNAIATAHTPNWNRLWATCPHTLISASGSDVGLPEGQMGNSEVGHLTMGAGRIIYQDLSLINSAIADQSFAQNPVLREALQQNNTVHILGLLSPGGVHSHEEHIFALINMAPKTCNIVVHPFLDGRDTPPQSAQTSLQKLASICAQHPNVQIADLIGRYYAMDRDQRQERTQAAAELLTKGKAPFTAPDVQTALAMAYARGETDEFVQPTKITSQVIRNGDTVIFMNFRADRARQLCYALLDQVQVNLITCTEYDRKLKATVAFPKQTIHNTFGEIIAKQKLRQLRIAETEKYAHVTYFFNAGQELPFAGEERILIPSVKVATYDLAPAMSATEITDAIVNAINTKSHAVIIANYANADMVGHTGNLTATISAIETLDICLGRIVRALQQYGGQALITADHGNAEIMWDVHNQQPHTAHTANLVPLVYVGSDSVKILTGNFGLQDIAPTLLHLLNISAPPEMSGKSILI